MVYPPCVILSHIKRLQLSQLGNSLLCFWW